MLQHDGNGMLLKSDANNLANDCCNDGGGGGGGGGGPTSCGDCQDTYFIKVNLTSGTCVAACTTLNVTNQAVTQVGTTCQWTWVNGDYTYELAFKSDDNKWHARIWHNGIDTGTLCVDWQNDADPIPSCPPIGSDLDGTWTKVAGACVGGFEVLPNMLLTVSGASSTINWCGRTWSLPTESGVTKTASPTTYNKGQYVTPNTVAQHRWLHSPSGLGLARFYNRFGGSSFTAVNTVKVDANGTVSAVDWFSWFGFTFSPTPSIVYSRQDIGVLSAGDQWPTYSSYLIGNNFFGSYATGGITYAWAKGSGW